jgi:aspartyl-tRNA synthetase
VVVDQATTPDAHKAASDARPEYVLQVHGKVRVRPEGTANPDLATGEVEVVASDIRILNASKTPPFYINVDDDNIEEARRMQYRYLDLRRPSMQHNVILRHR